MPGSRVHDCPRRHDIDALRVFAFALLIAYHVGMFYVAGWHWHVKSSHAIEWLVLPMALMHQWRMPLLFMVSGLAASFLLRRSNAGPFARSRTVRLLLPLLFGMAVIVPPQAYLQAVSNGAYTGAYTDFLRDYFTLRAWPPGAFDGSNFGVTWNHLWYLPYVLTYSLLLAGLLPLLNSRAGAGLRDRFRALRGARLLLLPALPLALATWLLSRRFPHTHALIGDWHNHGVYFTVFFYGYWAGTDRGLWMELKQKRWPLLAAAAITCAVFATLSFRAAAPAAQWQHAAFALIQHLYQWSVLLAVFGWGHHLLNRPFRWLPYATEAVYPWYVLHQTVIVIAGYQLAKHSFGPLAEAVLLLLITVLGCLVLHELVIRRVNALRPLFGLKPRASESPAAAAHAPDAS